MAFSVLVSAIVAGAGADFYLEAMDAAGQPHWAFIPALASCISVILRTCTPLSAIRKVPTER
jgi:hypothetical protein